MTIDINELYNVICNSIQDAIRDNNFNYNEMSIFGNDEIQLELENGKHITIYINIENEEDLD